MEIFSEGKHFRLVQENELPTILKLLEAFLPESIKVCTKIKILYFIDYNINLYFSFIRQLKRT